MQFSKIANTRFSKIFLLVIGLIISTQIFWNISVRISPREFPEIWETAKFENLQFKIEYPREWLIRELPRGNHGDEEVFLSMGEEIRCLFCVRFGDIGPSVYVAHKSFELPSDVNVPLWGKERAEERSVNGVYEIEKTETIQKDGYRIIVRTYHIKNSLSNELESSADIYVIREEDAFIFSLVVEPKDYEEIYPIFERIALSFDSIR
ncbi:hypothetical protein [Candidatus Leptofilum sp.]|uniref:hypothetical protein n=1 Tax=Candidatus Leptofilum sp. TaxID=3241576 RepID=UPI003B5A6DA1